MNDLISRQAAIDAFYKYPNIGWTTLDVLAKINALPSAQPEIIRCKDCVHYDKPHVENNGARIEYDDLPEETFENCMGGLVNSSYGINIGGRCCRDYNAGYSEDKRVFVPETNYCGRAERKEE